MCTLSAQSQKIARYRYKRAKLRIMQVTTITTCESRALSLNESGLIAGLKNARPDGAPAAQGKHQSMSAKERRRIAAEERKSAGKARKQAESRVAKVEAEILKLETEQTELSKQLRPSRLC